jgi:hypothetical protein
MIGHRSFGISMNRSVCVLSALWLFGCASYTGVVPMGQDTFMIAKQQATGFPGLGNMKAEILTEANQHCAQQGKEMVVVNTTESQPPYVFGNYPRAEVQFRCAPK